MLRTVQTDDIATFFDHQNDQVAADMAAFPIRDRPAHDAHWAKILADPTTITRAIVADGVVVGNIGSWVGADGRELGYWIGRPHWGQGHASRALADFVTEVTERPLTAHVVEQNAGSIRVLVKCGFTVVGTHQEDGDPVTELILRLDT